MLLAGPTLLWMAWSHSQEYPEWQLAGLTWLPAEWLLEQLVDGLAPMDLAEYPEWQLARLTGCGYLAVARKQVLEQLWTALDLAEDAVPPTDVVGHSLPVEVLQANCLFHHLCLFRHLFRRLCLFRHLCLFCRLCLSHQLVPSMPHIALSCKRRASNVSDL